MNIFSLIKNSKQSKYLILIIILLLIELKFIKIKKLPMLHSDHWIVMNAYSLFLNNIHVIHLLIHLP